MINPLAYLAAGDSAAERRGDWATNTKTCTETHARQHRLTRFAGMHIFSKGVAMVTPVQREKKLQCDPTRTEDTLLDPSGQPRQKNLPLSFLKE